MIYSPGATNPIKCIYPGFPASGLALTYHTAAFEKEASGLSKSPARTPQELGMLEPGDLLRLFRAIELQNLNALIYLESLGGPMTDMITRIDVAGVSVKREIDDVLESIQQLEVRVFV